MIQDMLKTIKMILISLARSIKLVKNWHVGVYDILTCKILPIKQRTYTLRDGTKYSIDATFENIIIFAEIFLYKNYNPTGFEIKENDVVFDLGGQAGAFSVYSANSAKHGQVYSFEPYKKNYELLKNNLSINNIKNVIAYNKAVSSKEGVKKLLISKNSSGANSLFIKPVDFEREITVNTIPLNSIIKRNNIKKINFMKIDIEGSEFDVLFNCPKQILNSIEKISMEVHDLDAKNNSRTLKKFLEENGFTVNIKEIPFYKNMCMMYVKRQYHQAL
jgi:FkbM family methyltransferase